MPLAADRTRLAFVLLAAALLLVVGAAVASVVSLHDPVLATIVAVAAAAGVLGGALAYAASREEDGAPGWERDRLPAPTHVPTPMRSHAPNVMPGAPPRIPIRIHSMPVADLPPAYLAAVMKGVQANRTARQARVLPGAELRH